MVVGYAIIVQVTFMAGNTVNESTACATINSIDDLILEGDHSFTVSIASTSPNVTIAMPSSAEVTIMDNEGMEHTPLLADLLCKHE